MASAGAPSEDASLGVGAWMGRRSSARDKLSPHGPRRVRWAAVAAVAAVLSGNAPYGLPCRESLRFGGWGPHVMALVTGSEMDAEVAAREGGLHDRHVAVVVACLFCCVDGEER